MRIPCSRPYQPRKLGAESTCPISLKRELALTPITTRPWERTRSSILWASSSQLECLRTFTSFTHDKSWKSMQNFRSTSSLGFDRSSCGHFMRVPSKPAMDRLSEDYKSIIGSAYHRYHKQFCNHVTDVTPKRKMMAVP